MVFSGSKIIEKALDLYFNRRNKNIEVQNDRRHRDLPKGEEDKTKVE